jgi:hypothetical protein
MRNQLLAGAIALALAAGITTSAMAFDRGGGFHGGGLHSGYSSFRGSHGDMRGSNFSGIRGFSSRRDGGRGGRSFVGGHSG